MAECESLLNCICETLEVTYEMTTAYPRALKAEIHFCMEDFTKRTAVAVDRIGMSRSFGVVMAQASSYVGSACSVEMVTDLAKRLNAVPHNEKAP